jgi:cyclopropane fatty-acyl-phospholipid synthase-like methyltransferase
MRRLGLVDRRVHWESVYGEVPSHELGWFQEEPLASLELLEELDVDRSAAILDVGGGDSRLVDGLLDRGFEDLTVLDLSAKALERSRARLDARSMAVTWIEADVTSFRPEAKYDVWHDRAVFHFLTKAEWRAGYRSALLEALSPGGNAIIATFAADGPRSCSGLPIRRYSPESLAAELGGEMELVDARPVIHATPGGGRQNFNFCLFRRH